MFEEKGKTTLHFFIFSKSEKCGLHLYSAPLGQYFVAPCFALSAAGSLCGLYLLFFNIVKFYPGLLSEIVQAQSDWIDSICYFKIFFFIKTF